MSIIIKETGKNVIRDPLSTTFEVIEKAIGMGISPIAIVHAENEDDLMSMKPFIIYGNSYGPLSPKNTYGEQVSGFYSMGENAFPLVLSDPSEKIQGYFEVNIGTIVYYPNRALSTTERPLRLIQSEYTIYTSEPFVNIVKEYSEKRKCLIVRESLSEEDPKAFDSKTEQLEGVEFMNQITGGRTIK